jgi:hypothetical protein
MHIYELSKMPLQKVPQIRNCTALTGEKILQWEVEGPIPNNDFNFQVQIAEDSSFRWLISGSRDGFPSKYRHGNNPHIAETWHWQFTPPKIMEGMMNGTFGEITGNQNPEDIRSETQDFFAQILFNMIDAHLTFGQGINSMNNEGWGNQFIKAINQCYNGNCTFLDAHAEEYIKSAGLSFSLNDLKNHHKGSTNFAYQPNEHFTEGKRYYWRVRLKHGYQVMSSWSVVNSFSM